jgi:cytochrome c-type biogenesis protein CcmH/NrfG
MSARIGVAIMAALLLLYIVLVGQRAYLLLTSGDALGIGMGVALVVLPLVAVWALGRELWFGWRAEQLGKRLEREGGLPDEQIEVRPSGRPVREDADALFPLYRAQAEERPDDWRSWFRLGIAYDGAGDRRRAREAVRKAIALETAERRASDS